LPDELLIDLIEHFSKKVLNTANVEPDMLGQAYEYLIKKKRQARVVILREAHPGYIMPVGVWNVRENVRAALLAPANKFRSLDEAFAYISTRLVIPRSRWVKESKVLKETLFQRGLEDFFGKS